MLRTIVVLSFSFKCVLDAENITMGKFLTCLIRKVTDAVDSVSETLENTKQLQSFLPEAVPDDVDEIPTLADIGRCGLNTAMTGKTFDQLCEMKMFESWLYKVIVMLPYSYPLRAHHKDV